MLSDSVHDEAGMDDVRAVEWSGVVDERLDGPVDHREPVVHLGVATGAFGTVPGVGGTKPSTPKLASASDPVSGRIEPAFTTLRPPSWRRRR